MPVYLLLLGFWRREGRGCVLMAWDLAGFFLRHGVRDVLYYGAVVEGHGVS